MKVTTNTKKQFSGYYDSVTIEIANDGALWVDGRIAWDSEQVAVRLRDTAEAMLAAAEYLDTLK